MGGKGKGKESKGNVANAEDDKAAARARLRREIQQAKADLGEKKPDRQEKRDEPGKGRSTWEKRDEPGKGRSAWEKRDEPGKGRSAWKSSSWDTDYNYNYKSSSGDKWEGGYDYKSRYDNRDKGPTKAWNYDNRDKGSTKGSNFDNRDKGSTKGSNFDNRDKGSRWNFDNRDKGSTKGSNFDNRDKGPTKGSNFGKEQDVYGKGKGKSKDKGKGDFDDSEPGMRLQDLEKRLTNSDDVQKAKAANVTTPLESNGLFCEVRKHTDMGCAVVSMDSEADRDAVLELGKRSLSSKGRPQVDIAGVTADMRPHTEGNLGIFVAWGHGREKQTPLSPIAIAEAFDNLYREIKGMPISPTTQPASIIEQPKDQPQMRQEQQQQSVPQMSPIQVPQTQNAQAALFAAQRQMMLQQMALAAAGGQVQRPLAPQQNMQQMAAAFAAAGQALAQALNMPKAGNVATNFSSSTPVVNTMGQQPQGYMRAEAPTFTPVVGQQNQWSQQFQQMTQPNTDMTQMWYSNNSQLDTSSLGQQSAPERRPLQIVDPQSGKAIETPVVASSPSALDYLDVKPPTRRALTIVDPSSGKTVDTLAAVNFKPAEGKKLSIIDPSNGSTVKI